MTEKKEFILEKITDDIRGTRDWSVIYEQHRDDPSVWNALIAPLKNGKRRPLMIPIRETKNPTKQTAMMFLQEFFEREKEERKKRGLTGREPWRSSMKPRKETPFKDHIDDLYRIVWEFYRNYERGKNSYEECLIYWTRLKTMVKDKEFPKAGEPYPTIRTWIYKEEGPRALLVILEDFSRSLRGVDPACKQIDDELPF